MVPGQAGKGLGPDLVPVAIGTDDHREIVGEATDQEISILGLYHIIGLEISVVIDRIGPDDIPVEIQVNEIGIVCTNHGDILSVHGRADHNGKIVDVGKFDLGLPALRGCLGADANRKQKENI